MDEFKYWAAVTALVIGGLSITIGLGLHVWSATTSKHSSWKLIMIGAGNKIMFGGCAFAGSIFGISRLVDFIYTLVSGSPA
ncbi:hypothetical protein ACFSSA_13460 [Luteolibacter algae]|uniref:Uncharacterized protein n=1 Tax=Luteolibacter algae TaxID=454151 RepID=A0ABW5DB51_9BACT